MPRKRRVEYAGAMFRMMSRGDRREHIFLADLDRLPDANAGAFRNSQRIIRNSQNFLLRFSRIIPPCVPRNP